MRRVFTPAAAIILAFVALTVSFPDTSAHLLESIQQDIVRVFGWYYVLLIAGFVAFALWMGLGPYGDIKLGKDDDKPEFSTKAWFAMLFAGGMGIGLVFWGVAEPLSHYAEPKPRVEGDAETLAEKGMAQTFLHWGLHSWAVYVIIGLALAYAIHRKDRPVSIRWALEPLLGRKVLGRLGDAIDVSAIIATMFGVATSLGLGVLQISAGLQHRDIADNDTSLQVILIVIITAAATVSVVSGLTKGLKWLSNINVVMAASLLGFVLIAGPTLFLLREFVESLGFYLTNVLSLTFSVSAYAGPRGERWQGEWTTFFWGSWISWAPAVGVFIARISRGRTVREFVAGVLLVPALVSFLWFAVLGGAALDSVIFGDGGAFRLHPVVPEFATFDLLDGLPASGVTSLFVIALVAMFFITSSDSGSFVIAMLACGGDPVPPAWTRVFWAVASGGVAIALLLAGGLAALRTGVVLMALPFSAVMIGIGLATATAFKREHDAVIEAERALLHSQINARITDELKAIVEERSEEERKMPAGPQRGPRP